LAHQVHDDGFHEIQLNGKQLVFLFMAATVVSVVIFLCGVLVGRGVRAERGAIAPDGTVASAPPIEPVPQARNDATPPPVGSDPRAAAPPPPADDLSYFDRLEKQKQPKEELKKAPPSASAPAPPPAAASAAKPAPAAETVAKPAPPPPPPTPKPAPPERAVQATSSDTAGEFTVQIAALNARGEADAIAHRLTSKGYAAYVVPPGNGAAMYRVRVGKFKSRRDAEPVAARLQKEEQYKPWITR
jgi:DedD protein